MKFSYSLNEISNITKGSIYGNDNIFIEHLITDSRNYIHGENHLFIALNTAKRDGHQFIKEAYDKGVRNFLISCQNLLKCMELVIIHYL